MIWTSYGNDVWLTAAHGVIVGGVLVAILLAHYASVETEGNQWVKSVNREHKIKKFFSYFVDFRQVLCGTTLICCRRLMELSADELTARNAASILPTAMTCNLFLKS